MPAAELVDIISFANTEIYYRDEILGSMARFSLGALENIAHFFLYNLTGRVER